MKIDWNINYIDKIATCSQMSVEIREVATPLLQKYKDIEIGIGFQKIESGKMYQCYIINASETLLQENKKNNKLLPNYASQLGDCFNEYEWDDNK
jgi:hypothetical protein